MAPDAVLVNALHQARSPRVTSPEHTSCAFSPKAGLPTEPALPCDFQEPEVDMSSHPGMGPWVMGSSGRQEPQSQLLPAPHSISDSLELGVSPCWNKTLTLKQNRQRQPAKPLPSQPVGRGHQQISSHCRLLAGISLQSLRTGSLDAELRTGRVRS